VAQSVWTGGSRHTGLAAPPHRNIQYDLGTKIYFNEDNAFWAKSIPF
jgi:hypothetical protein